MARIKLIIPEYFEFSTEIQVRISDINYGGHLGNDSLLSLIHESRCRFLNHYGMTELHIDNINGNIGLILTDSVIVYKSEAFYGDILVIEVATNDFTKHGCDFVYRITSKSTGKEVAVAKTGVVFFEYVRKKVVRIPERFKAIAHG